MTELLLLWPQKATIGVVLIVLSCKLSVQNESASELFYFLFLFLSSRYYFNSPLVESLVGLPTLAFY